MPVLFVVCGLPFSGKTMLAEKIARSADAVLVSYDALWRENRPLLHVLRPPQ